MMMMELDKSLMLPKILQFIPIGIANIYKVSWLLKFVSFYFRLDQIGGQTPHKSLNSQLLSVIMHADDQKKCS